MVGVPSASAIADKEHLAPGLPAISQLIGESFDRRPVEGVQGSGQTPGIVAEKLGRCRKRQSVHFISSLSIHFRLYQRSSSLSCPCEYMPIISVMASSTVFFGRKPVANRRSELT